jgi:hypothetical protein
MIEKKYDIKGQRVEIMTPNELFDNTFKYMDENIVPRLLDRSYSKEKYYFFDKFGNYSGEKINDILINNKVNNDLPEKFITFIIPIKNRTERLNIQLENLCKVLDFKQVDIIIVEDISDDNFNIEVLSENIKNHIRYYQVNTNTTWSRSKLMNFGISKTITPLILANDVDFIFSEHFLKELRECCNNTNFNKYSIGLSLWESHDSYWNDNKIMRYAYEPYSACYIYNTEILKRIGGFDTSIINHGTEDRELQKRLSQNGCETIYGHLLYPKLYVIHYSHDNITRGPGRSLRDQYQIMNKNDKIIPFIFELEVIKSYN